MNHECCVVTDNDGGPLHCDCPCRMTEEMARCAAEGCGFCRAEYAYRVIQETAEDVRGWVG